MVQTDPDPFDGALGLDGPLLEALAGMPVPMWLVDRRGHIRWMSVAAASLLGSKIGSHFSGLVAPESVADTREILARKIDGRLESTMQRVTLLTAAGAAEVDLTSVPVRDAGGVTALMALVRHAPDGDARRRPKPRLTPRQHQVLELLAEGRSTSEIAERLEISEDTVRNHVRYLLAELRVRTRLEAVVVAFRNGWL